ncbi:MAG: hypothetical protein FWG94_05540 [Oscillospiraceae bacterium]|nr:hypothetical protein [Oscillospiraceae bacterium]
MVLLSDYRLVEQGGLFFRKDKCRELLPGMFGGAFGAGLALAYGDQHNRTQGKPDDTSPLLP